ncbi:MAG TPA: MtrB/PioB family decaheme-associated outer membrane protein [Xanthomonadales bacterium]|nr:MtrB/PioB family decaheme-associated outer membrane protein [Xanthomonadales bacterium]
MNAGYRHPLHRCRPGLLALAIGACLFTGQALAQDDEFSLDEEPVAEQAKPEDAEAKRRELTEQRNWVEIGAGWTSDDSAKFGRYNGLDDDGLYGILSFDYGRRGAWDAPDAGYWRMTGTDLGLDTREVTYERGVQGDWRLTLGYDQIPAQGTDSARTIFVNPGDSTLALPANWVPGQTTAAMPRLNESLRDFDLEQMRRRFDVGFRKDVGKRWQVDTQYRRETKTGEKSLGAVIGNSGGNPRSVILPEPVDYATDQIDATLRWGTEKAQFQAAYYGSLFHNDNTALTWTNPFSAINGWDASAGYPTGQGSISSPPDNQFHQLSLAGGWNFSPATRFTGDVAFGRMKQDDRFLPYTINPTLAASVTQPLPRDSLDGRIDTTVVNLGVYSRPTDRFHWNAAYRYDDRDNRTPRDEYVYIGGDSQTQQTGTTSSFRRYNEPLSYREQKLRLDGGFELSDRFNLDGWAEWRTFDRTFSEREEADEDTIGVQLRSDFSDRVSGYVRLSRADRSGSTYVGNEPFLQGYDPDYTATVPGNFENPPDLRKYHLADRTRDSVQFNLTFTPGEHWSLGFNANRLDDDYDSSELGLTKGTVQDATFDVAWTPTPEWTTYGFHTYEKLVNEQDGQSIGGGTRVQDAVNPARSWFADHVDHARTTGIGLAHPMFDGRVDTSLDFVRSRTQGDVSVTTGAALTSGPLPRDVTRLDALSLQARWHWRKDVAIHFTWRYEDYESTDFALDGVEPNQLANVIGLGNESPDYHVNVLGLSFNLAF